MLPRYPRFLAAVLWLAPAATAAQATPPVPDSTTPRPAPTPQTDPSAQTPPSTETQGPAAAPSEQQAEGLQAPAAEAGAPAGAATEEPQEVPPGVVESEQSIPGPPDSEDAAPPEDPLELEVHAFVSQGFLVTTRNNYLAKSKNGSFEFAEAGINFTKPLTDRLRAGLQLFARDLGPVGNYDIKLDWFYLDYRFNDWLGLRAGRVKLPFGLYNDSNDVDSARTFVLPPQAVYPTENRDFLLAQTGFELYGYLDLSCCGALDYRLYGGTILIDISTQPSGPTEIDDINIPYIVGGRLFWETPLDGLRAGGSVQALRLDVDVLFDMATVEMLQMAGMLDANATGLVSAKVPALLWIGSVEYAAHDLLFAAEYSRWHTEVESSEPMLQPETKTTAERMYALLAYRVTPWLQPGVYYGLYFPDTKDRSGREKQQHDVALTFRFDVNEHWLVKLEGHYMNGTAALRTRLNDGTSLDQLDRSWILFLAKTTAYF